MVDGERHIQEVQTESKTLNEPVPLVPEENASLGVPYPIIRSNFSTQEFFARHNLDIKKPYTKKELAELGYAMYNRVGDGQVAIIKEIGGQDTRDDALITKEQLRRHIEESLPQGIEIAELPSIVADMEKFMNEVQILTAVSDLVDPEGRLGGTWMQNYAMQFLDQLDSDYPDWDVMTKAQQAEMLDWEKRGEIIREATSIVKSNYQIPDNVRGIPLTMLDRRGEGRGVFGNPCPCMECEHIFPATDGIKIYDDGSVTGVPGQVRMNVVTSHLSSHGINNNQNQTVDRDHRYMTLESYQRIYAKRAMDDEGPNILRLNYKKIEQEVLTQVLIGIRKRIGLEEQLTDMELEKRVKEMLFIRDDTETD